MLLKFKPKKLINSHFQRNVSRKQQFSEEEDSGKPTTSLRKSLPIIQEELKNLDRMYFLLLWEINDFRVNYC
jgi:hypothetical protein